MQPWWFLMVAVPALASEPSPVTVSVWGPPAGFEAGDRPLATVLDATGRPCLLDASGLSCFDAEGGEAWGVEVPGVEDVLVAGDRRVLLTPDGALIVDGATGATRARLSGRVGVSAEGAVWSAGLDGLAGEDAAPRPLPPGAQVLDLVVGGDRAGFVDDAGDVVWVGADGTTSRVPLGLAVEDGVRVVPLSEGWAVLDAAGLAILDGAGRLAAEVEVDARDVVEADGELWVAAPDGVWAVDRRSGRVDPERVAAGDVQALAASADGEGLVLLDRGADRLRLPDRSEDGPVHLGAVVAVAPTPDGGLVSVDAAGGALRWTAAGVPERLARQGVWDAAVDGGGRLWTVGPEGLRGPEAAEGPGDRLTALPDGVMVGDGLAVRRLDAAGTPVWSATVPHEGRPRVAGDGVGLVHDGAVTWLDLATGARRRWLADVGVAVGGLVVAGRREDRVRIWRPAGPASTGTGFPPEARVRLAPGGRWAAVDLDGAVRIVEAAGGEVFERRPEAAITAWALGRTTLWLGRADGRVERWEVGPAVVDAPLPPFNGYAQLDPLPEVPPGPDPLPRLTAPGPVAALAVLPEGRVAVAAGVLAIRDDAGGVTVPVVDPPLVATALAWGGDASGLVVAGADGRVIRVEEGAPVELGRVPGPVDALCATEGAVLAASSAGVRAVASGAPLAGLPAGRATDLACAPDGAWVAAVVDGRAVLAAADGRRAFLRAGAPTTAVVALPDGGLLSGGRDEAVTSWDPLTWAPGGVLDGQGAAVTDLAVDGAGRRVVAGTEDGAVVWDLAAWAPVARLAPGRAIRAVAMDQAGERVWLGTATVGVLEAVLPAPEPPPAGPAPGVDLPGPPENLPPADTDRVGPLDRVRGRSP